jgi:hypothetical protein
MLTVFLLLSLTLYMQTPSEVVRKLFQCAQHIAAQKENNLMCGGGGMLLILAPVPGAHLSIENAPREKDTSQK